MQSKLEPAIPLPDNLPQPHGRPMKMNLVIDSTPGAWTQGYAETLPSVLRALGFDVRFVRSDHVGQASTPDVWFLAGLYDRCLPEVVRRMDGTQSRLFAHAHGGPEQLGFVDWESNEPIFDAFKLAAPRIEAIFTNTVRHGELLTSYWTARGVKMPKLVLTGFPIDTQRFRTKVPKGALPDRIVVPGRLNYAKQPLVAAQVLLPWKSIVTFSKGENYGECRESDEFSRVLQRWGFTVTISRGARYVELLQESTVAFNASMVECACTAMLEAAAAGCVCVVPDRMFFDYYAPANRYTAYDLVAARERVQRALERRADWRIGVDADWFDVQAVAARMAAAIHG